MSDIEKIKKLREATGAGFKDCNLAIKESDGNLDKAVEILRVKGISKASKKMSRDAKEGVVAISGDEKKTSIIEVNCETDFVAKNNDFIDFVKELSDLNNKKNSNIFGSISNNFSENINVGYDFIIDNDLNTLKYNSLNTILSYKNLTSEFNFLEESGELGSTNTLANKTKLKFNDENFLSFSTRRNREIDLTEYYNLIYEYKNDCLTAAIQYNKDYYSDKDLKPNEEIFFSISIVPFSKINSPSKRK